MAEVKDPIFPGSIDFINLKIQEISTRLAPAISAAIDTADKDPDDILIEITELLDAMDQEVRSWSQTIKPSLMTSPRIWRLCLSSIII